ncbi:MAG: hypothetical protein HN952_06885 [Candidatus Cloacimonetes bacterium]|nr:hypothetical protein [Candidatus Cloacimonadota bacterium]MBT6994659.1 hypothetical protein [Candidatus Cloacimonadota bacterium]MBT7469104.1 hypothetical protein [Candidatus Cloacimonadota bacterium]
MKKVTMIVLLVVFMVSALSVWSIVKKGDGQLITKVECRASGDFQPKPLNDNFVAPILPKKSETLLCVAGDFKPRPIKRDSLLLCVSGDFKPRPLKRKKNDVTGS